jgi:hypothetical protein
MLPRALSAMSRCINAPFVSILYNALMPSFRCILAAEIGENDDVWADACLALKLDDTATAIIILNASTTSTRILTVAIVLVVVSLVLLLIENSIYLEGIIHINIMTSLLNLST